MVLNQSRSSQGQRDSEELDRKKENDRQGTNAPSRSLVYDHTKDSGGTQRIRKSKTKTKMKMTGWEAGGRELANVDDAYVIIYALPLYFSRAYLT